MFGNFGISPVSPEQYLNIYEASVNNGGSSGILPVIVLLLLNALLIFVTVARLSCCNDIGFALVKVLKANLVMLAPNLIS